MTADKRFLAFDFGAESGRALLGTISGGRIALDEIHRFPNTPVKTLGAMHWDALRLFGDIKHGLRQALNETDGTIDGIGIDTWGVDFGLIGADGELLGNPFHYRDTRTEGMMDEAFAVVGRERVFDRTGIQFLPFNTLFQLVAMAKSGSPALANATRLLMMPDLFNYWLTGKQLSEFSIATTTQCYDPRKGDWARDMLTTLGIPTKMLPEIVQPGATIGPLAQSLVDELGAGDGVPVIAPATHDTGSAVAAVPASGTGHAYISSGTWSLMGVEIDKPLINEDSLAANFTNEGGVAGTFRFLKNIMGLWLVQECRRDVDGGGRGSVLRRPHTDGRAKPRASPVDHRSRLRHLPRARRHAPAHQGLLRQHRPARPANQGRDRPMRARQPRASLSLDHRAPRRALRHPPRPDPHRRRRHAEQAALPTCRGRDRPDRDCGAHRGDRHRQRARYRRWAWGS